MINRQIKFRAWREKTKDMMPNNTLLGLLDLSYANRGLHDPGGVVWMQFIGLTCKNGVHIYEGDILDQSKYPEDDPCPYSVIFEDGAFRKKYIEWGEALSKPVLTQREVDLLDDVVIGNIFEHPEILEKNHEQ